jgi:hypothetical protein
MYQLMKLVRPVECERFAVMQWRSAWQRGYEVIVV